MADFTNRNADETKEYILTFDENGGSPEYTKIEDANGVDRTAEVVELLGINDKEDADPTILKEADVEDTLNSTSTTKPLSANQGKQLNDDKASLSGANFTDMPNVDGSPIVERGSNSDGEFVRFADGTQLCSIRNIGVSYSSGESMNGTWTFPNQFFETPIVSSGALSNSTSSWESTGSANNRHRVSFAGIIQETETFANLRLIFDSSVLSSGASYNALNYHATGRWY